MAEDQPEFNENIELFKLQILSEDERASHYTFVAAFLAVFAGYGIYLIQNQRELVTFTVALTLGGVGLIFAILVFRSIPHGRFMDLMNDYTRQVQRRERLPDFVDLYSRGRTIRNWLRSRTSRSDQSRHSRRGVRFFLMLSLTLWFTGLFAWSQTVLWQSALSEISRPSSGYQVAIVTGEGMAETVIVAVLFAVYLRVIYNASELFREVFDGLFGLRRRENGTTNPVT